MKRLLILLFLFIPVVATAQQPTTHSVTPAAQDDATAKPASTEKKGGKDEQKKTVVNQTIVVTATRSERELADVPVSTTVISKEEIESSTAEVADDLIRTIPGVHMPLGSSLAQQVAGERFSMRGLGGTHALVLLDGVPIHDPYYGTVEWEKVSLDEIQQVEIVRGGSGSLFGNYAMGGTVNLITRPVVSNGLKLDLSRGEFATNRAVLSADYRIRDGLGVRLSQYDLRTDGYYNAVNPAPVDIPVWNDTAITSFRADFNTTSRTSGYFKTNWSRIDLSGGTLLSRYNRRILDVAGAVHHQVGPMGLLSVTVFDQDEKLHAIATSLINGGESDYVSNDSVVPATATGASVEWSTPRGGAISFVSAGLDLQQLEADETWKGFGSDGAQREEHLVRGRQRFAGVYGQASWRPTDRLEVLASARFDYYKNYDGADFKVGGPAQIFPETTTHQIDPRVAVRYETGSRSAIRGAAYRSFAAPNLRELYRNNQTGRTIILGNPNLEPETMIGGEIGYDFATPRASLGITLYRNDVDQPILRGNVEGQPANVIQYMNVGSARSQGVEATVEVRPSRQWAFSAGYTYADSKITSNPSDPSLEGKLVPEVVPQIGTLGVRYRGDDGLGIDFRWRVLSRSYGEPQNVNPAPAHRVLDVNVSRPVSSWLDLYLRGANVLDERYYYVLTAVTTRAVEPRNVSFGARIHLPMGPGW